MTGLRAFCLPLLVIALASAGAATAAAEEGAPPGTNALATLAKAYFAAVTIADGRAIAEATTGSFHLILPDGKRMSADDFMRRLSAHYLVSSTPITTVKIGASSNDGTTATQTVETSSWDYALVGAPYNPTLERDYATHQLTWVKSTGGRWLLDEDRVTASVHTP